MTDVTPEPDTGPVPGQPEPGPYDELQGHQPVAEAEARGEPVEDQTPAPPPEPEPAPEPQPEPPPEEGQPA